VSCGDLLGDAAWDQLAQHRVQPAGDLGPGAAQVAVALGPHLQHRRVIVGLDLAAGRRAQRRDSDRPGVVGVVLVHRPIRQQPHPGAQLGLHVQDPLTRGQQLLGQQVTQAARALDGPGPLRPGRRPGQQLLGLRYRSTHAQLTQRLLRRADRHRRVRALVRIDAYHHCSHERPSLNAGCDRGGHALFQDLLAFTPLSRAAARTRRAGASLISQTASSRQAVREPAHRTSGHCGQAAAPAPILQ
jgi:hypothetical protein